MSTTPPHRIVLAEDNQDIRELIVMTLERQRFEVVARATGDQALDVCLQDPPDLVLLDVSMPGELDGLAVTRSLRAHPATAEVPVILLTARAQEADVIAGMTAGANDYLVKPFSPSLLVASIVALIAHCEPPRGGLGTDPQTAPGVPKDPRE